MTGVVAGALLRAGARVFVGLGPPAPRDPAGDEAPEGESGDLGATSRLLWGTAAVLLLAAVAWGWLPGLTGAVARGAAAFTDQHGYAAAVLGGGAPGAPAPPVLRGPGATAYAYAALSLLVAAACAAAPLRTAESPRALRGLRAIHNGRLGDYAAWTVLGAALLVSLFTSLLR